MFYHNSFTNKINSVTVDCLYDKYHQNNIQYQGISTSLISYFQILSTTQIIIERRCDRINDDFYFHNNNNNKNCLSKYYQIITENEVFTKSLRGYLSLLLMTQRKFKQNESLQLINSILLSGPSGSGKTLLISQQIQSFLPQYLSTLRISLGTLQPYSDQLLISLLNRALVCQPSVILLDRLEYLIPSDEKASNENEMSPYCNIPQVNYRSISKSLLISEFIIIY